MNRFLSKTFSENPKPVLRHAEGSAIQNRKLVGIVVVIITFAMCGAVAEAQQPAKPKTDRGLCDKELATIGG